MATKSAPSTRARSAMWDFDIFTRPFPGKTGQLNESGWRGVFCRKKADFRRNTLCISRKFNALAEKKAVRRRSCIWPVFPNKKYRTANGCNAVRKNDNDIVVESTSYAGIIRIRSRDRERRYAPHLSRSCLQHPCVFCLHAVWIIIVLCFWDVKWLGNTLSEQPNCGMNFM